MGPLRSLSLSVLCFSLLPSQAWPHLPALYGMKYQRLVQIQPALTTTAPTCLTNEELERLEREREALRKHADDLESAEGAYGATLSEPLSDLARHYRERGDYDEAVRLYLRALHLQRISAGLQNENQLVLLAELESLYREQGDFTSLDDLHEYLFRHYGSDGSKLDQQSLNTALEYMNWQRQARDLRLRGNGLERLMRIYLLNERLLHSATEQRADDELKRKLLHSQLTNLYLIMAADLQPGNPAIATSRELHPSQSGTPEYIRQRIVRVQYEGIDRGTDLLYSLLALAEPEPTLHQARIRLELADWLQWNGEAGKAAAEYALVETTLLQLGEEQVLLQWLGEPVELPDPGLFRKLNPALDTSAAEKVMVQFTVSARGDAGRIEILESSGGSDGWGSRASRLLAETHFRPRFRQGRAQPVEALTREYQFYDQVSTAVSENPCSAAAVAENS
jgi:Tetratricopeptide repeat